MRRSEEHGCASSLTKLALAADASAQHLEGLDTCLQLCKGLPLAWHYTACEMLQMRPSAGPENPLPSWSPERDHKVIVMQLATRMW